MPHVRLLSCLRPQTHYLSFITHVDVYRCIPSSLPMPIVISLSYTLPLRPPPLLSFSHISTSLSFFLRPGLLLVLAWPVRTVMPIGQPLPDSRCSLPQNLRSPLYDYTPSYLMRTHPLFVSHHRIRTPTTVCFSLSPTPSLRSRMIWVNIYSVYANPRVTFSYCETLLPHVIPSYKLVRLLTCI
jgi:hypothetical protein